MKAIVIFINLLIACSSHVINKRSLLGGRETHGHHGHHQHHHQQHHRARNGFGRRDGRDGDHHHDESENEIRSAPSGYLPAADDYEDDLAGYNADQAGARSDDLAGYADDHLAGYENGGDGQAEGRGQAQYGDDQYQYGDDQEQYEDDQYQYEESSGAEPKNAEDNLSSEEGYSAPAEAATSDQGRSAGDGYGAPAVGSASNIDQSYAPPDAGRAADDGYGAPDAGRAADDGYGAPDAGRAADDEYGAPDGEGSGDEGSGYIVPEEAGARDVSGEYSAPPEEEDESRIADDSYAAPGAAGAESDYSAPRTVDDEYGAPGQYDTSQNGFPFAIVEGRQGSVTAANTAGQAGALPGNEEAKLCPGGSLDVCVSVCPGITARVYGACVQGCADRCTQI